MNKITAWMSFVLVFSLLGCTAPTPTPAPTAIPAQSATDVLLMDTPAPLPPATVTMTATPEARFPRQCLPVDNREVGLSEIALGTILVSWREPRGDYTDILNILSDIQTGNEYQLPSNSRSSFLISSAISPNRIMDAELESVYNERGVLGGNQIATVLWVFDARANIIAKIDFNRTDLVSLSWLDDERLIIITEKYGNLLLVNPFTGEQQVLADELPDLFPYNLETYSHIDPHSRWPISYSPDLQWVVYYSLRKETNGYMEGSVVYDTVTKQTIWKADSGLGLDWSPDGQSLAIASELGDRQLYLFSHAGQVKAVLDESLPHEVSEFSWSPDGHYIAFWNSESLMIYDRQMDWVFDTCISSNQSVSLRWSPDSRQMIVYVSGYSTQIMLVDWQEKMGYKIKELPHGGTLHGWMHSLP